MRLEFEAEGGETPAPAPISSPRQIAIEAADPVSTDSPATAPIMSTRPTRSQWLQERFTFDSFVKGPSNEFALAVARRVASWADGHFNPVVFHGAYGFGKTHLLNAIAWEAMCSAQPEKKVVLHLTAERFLSSFVRALMDRKAADFKDELRSADLLLIDDVHFIGGKHSSEEDLFHTLAALMEDGRRVVFSADRPALGAGLAGDRRAAALAPLRRPGLRDRGRRPQPCGSTSWSARRWCWAVNKDVTALIWPEVLQFLADRFTDSVRELEGALNTLIVRAGAGVGGLTLEETQAFLGPHLRGGEQALRSTTSREATADHFGLKQVDLISERRTRSVARPRQAAMWLAKKLTTRSLPDIGRRFGGRDHTTSVLAREVQHRIEASPCARRIPNWRET